LVENPPVHTLYQKFLDRSAGSEAAVYLWGNIPLNMFESHKFLKRIREAYNEPFDGLETIKKALKNHMKRLGILTWKTSCSIDGFDGGVVETGQQPNCLGGPSFIFNKITYTWALSGLGGGFVPLYYVGDYDSIQSELINIRVPSPSSRGMIITYPSPPNYEGAPIRRLPNPNEEWLRKTLEKLESNYRGLLKGVDPLKQEVALQNLSQVFTILKNAYFSTENVADFSTKIIGTIINLEADLGIPVLTATDPEIRGLFQNGYEVILSEPNRSNFIRASNEAVNLIEELGYKPPIGYRSDNYVPFFLECQTPSCHGSRVELKYNRKSLDSYIEGKCSRCEQIYSYSFDTAKPDLTEIATIITPRVDSRQIIVDSVIPVVAHIGGPGETSYYAEVIPGVAPLHIPFPTYSRYSRVFYNTPWNELAAKNLTEKGTSVLLRDKLFTALSVWVESKKNCNSGKMAQAHREIREVVDETYHTLLKKRNDLEIDVAEIKRNLNNPIDRTVLLQKMKAKQEQLIELDMYLSFAFGQYAPEKYGQEVSWAWIDLAIVSGINDIMGIYKRLYTGNTPNSSVFFVNL
jgi:uncharacterized protein YllA (UPF0747 family)